MVVGKVFLVSGLLAEEDFQKCLTIDPSIIAGPTNKLPLCENNSMNHFLLSLIFLGVGAGTFVYGWRSKAWMKKYT
jgi:hypothetical protein